MERDPEFDRQFVPVWVVFSMVGLQAGTRWRLIRELAQDVRIHRATAQQDLSIGSLLRIMKARAAAVARSVDPILRFMGEAIDVRRGLDSFFWKLLDGPGEDLTKLLGWTAAFLAALVVLIWGIVRVRSWFRDDDDPAAVDRTMLLGLGDLHRQGDLSESEYRSIKSQLIQRMQDPPSRDSEKPP